MGRRHRLQRQGRRHLGRHHRQGRLQPHRRPQAPHRDRPRRRDHLLARGQHRGRLRRRHPWRLHRHHRQTAVEDAKDLAALIEGGALPLELRAISDRLVGPSLGAAAIDASIEAGIIGLILTGLFIVIVYRLVGLMATLALTSYALLAYAMLVGLGSTLTLPGLAGFVLAIGMAIDANVLVFERAREEYQAYPSAGLRRALAVGFNKAWSAIIDSNVTTLLAAGLLFFLGSGPIKGFGVTLSIGVIASMISALIIARVLCDLAVANKPVDRAPRDQWSGQHRQGPHLARRVRRPTS